MMPSRSPISQCGRGSKSNSGGVALRADDDVLLLACADGRVGMRDVRQLEQERCDALLDLLQRAAPGRRSRSEIARISSMRRCRSAASAVEPMRLPSVVALRPQRLRFDQPLAPLSVEAQESRRGPSLRRRGLAAPCERRPGSRARTAGSATRHPPDSRLFANRPQRQQAHVLRHRRAHAVAERKRLVPLELRLRRPTSDGSRRRGSGGGSPTSVQK